MLVKKTTQFLPLNFEDSSPKGKEESSSREYIPKAPFPWRIVKGKKGNFTGEIIEIFKQVCINIPLLDALKKNVLLPSVLKTFALEREKFIFQRKSF